MSNTWISAKTPPDNNRIVLTCEMIYGEIGSVGLCRYFAGIWLDTNDEDNMNVQPDYWMDIPKLLKEEDNE